MSVWTMEAGGERRVTEVCLPAALRLHLAGLGILRGASLRLLLRRRSGAVILLRGVRYALGAAVAQGILVGGAESGERRT